MKKIIVLFSLVCLICACEKSKTTENVIINEEEAFDQILQSIDDLNASYGYVETRSIGKDVGVASCDAVGAYLGRLAGKHLGAGLGVITGNPVVGVVGYLGGRKFGGWAGATLASAIANELIPDENTAEQNPFVLESLPDCETGIYPSEEISFGDIHNYFLPKISNTETPFFTSEGTVNSEELFNDLQELADEYNVEDPLLSNDSWREVMASFYDDMATVLNNPSIKKKDSYTILRRLQSVMENHGVAVEETQTIIPVITKLTSCAASLRPNKVKPYERDYMSIVCASEISDEKKMELMDVGSVAIMSAAYWNAR